MGRMTRINRRSPSDMSEAIQTEKSGSSAPSGRLHPIVGWLFCMLRGHRVFSFRAPGEWSLRRCDDGDVEAECVDCGKTLKAEYGLAIPGFRLGTFRSPPNDLGI